MPRNPFDLMKVQFQQRFHLAILSTLVALAGSAAAAPITWNPPQPVTGTNDVSNQGAYFGSWAPYNSTAYQYPVNGVTFAENDLGITTTGFSSGGAYFGTHTTTDGDYNTLLASAIYGLNPTASFKLNGDGSKPLTVGHQYLVQFWVSDPRSLGITRSETVEGSQPLLFPANGSGMGHFITGTFTADATTQDFNLSATQVGGNGSSPQVNLLQVRDLSAPPGDGNANPATLSVGQSATISVTATPTAGNSVTGVTLDASAIGIPAPVTLNSTEGSLYSGTVTVGAGTIYGAQNLVATVTDSGGAQSKVNVPVFLPTPAAHKAPAPALETWRNDRFGLFIHWGPVTLTGQEISWSRANSNPKCPNNGPTPVATYDNLYTQFNPTSFNATQWVATAQAAGMKYIVLTAKHCDGFLLWNSATSSYNIMNSPFQRDVCAELAAAAHAAGMKLGWYYSPPDWKDPRFRNAQNAGYVKTMQAQLRELLTNYGTVDLLWFDCDSSPNPYDVANTYAMCRTLQPNMVLNNRLDIAVHSAWITQSVGPWADYYTPEGHIGAFDNLRPWETCMNLGTQWAWKPGDTYQSTQSALGTLLRCAGGDGNLLLNVGPDATGAFDPNALNSLAGIGNWLSQHGEAVYGTRGGPFRSATNFSSTRKDNAIYLHLLPAQTYVKLPPVPVNVVSASVLTGGTVTFTQNAESVLLTLSPAAVANPVVTVKLTLAEPAANLPVLAAGTMSASLPATTHWHAPRTIASSSEVCSQGSLVIARQATFSSAGGHPDQTVNGVPFLGTVNTANGATFALAGQTAHNASLFASAKTLSGPDAPAYQKILAGAWLGNTAPITASVSGLTPGKDYLVQLWANDFRKFTNARTETVAGSSGPNVHAPELHYLTGNGTNDGSGTGQFAIGTFTATGTSAGFDLTGNESSQLNAFQLRDITATGYDVIWNNATTSMNWNSSDANWTGGVWNNSPVNNAIFGLTGAGVVTLEGPVTARSLTFTAPGYTLTGGGISLARSQTLVAHADATIITPIASDTLTKTGTGTLTLAGSSSCTGVATVSDGALAVTGGLAASGGIAVGPGAVLSGTGSMTAVTISSGATLAPGLGDTPGTLTVGTLTLDPGSVAKLRIGTTSDSVQVSGDLVLNGTLQLVDTGSATSGIHTLFHYSGTLTGVPLVAAPTGFVATLDLSTPGAVRATLVADHFATWRRDHFNAEEIANLQISGPTATPAGDGMSNLIKYALGFDPKASRTGSGVSLVQSGGSPALLFQRPANRSDVVYSVEVSTDLQSWSSSGVTLSQTVTGDPQVWLGSYSEELLPKGFYRLRIEQQ